jgi:hypothetical protein
MTASTRVALLEQSRSAGLVRQTKRPDTPVAWGYPGKVSRSRSVRHAGPRLKEVQASGHSLMRS